jgi:hypothetical protein
MLSSEWLLTRFFLIGFFSGDYQVSISNVEIFKGLLLVPIPYEYASFAYRLPLKPGLIVQSAPLSRSFDGITAATVTATLSNTELRRAFIAKNAALRLSLNSKAQYDPESSISLQINRKKVALIVRGREVAFIEKVNSQDVSSSKSSEIVQYCAETPYPGFFAFAVMDESGRKLVNLTAISVSKNDRDPVWLRWYNDTIGYVILAEFDKTKLVPNQIDPLLLATPLRKFSSDFIYVLSDSDISATSIANDTRQPINDTIVLSDSRGPFIEKFNETLLVYIQSSANVAVANSTLVDAK